MDKEKCQIRTQGCLKMKYDVFCEAGCSGQDRQQYKQINERGVRRRNMGTEGENITLTGRRGNLLQDQAEKSDTNQKYHSIVACKYSPEKEKKLFKLDMYNVCVCSKYPHSFYISKFYVYV